MDKKFIQEKLATVFDTVRVGKDGLVVCKRSFFYRHGCDAQKLAESVQKLIPGSTIIKAEEFWKRWPADSYWRVEFKMEVAQ